MVCSQAGRDSMVSLINKSFDPAAEREMIAKRSLTQSRFSLGNWLMNWSGHSSLSSLDIEDKIYGLALLCRIKTDMPQAFFHCVSCENCYFPKPYFLIRLKAIERTAKFICLFDVKI